MCYSFIVEPSSFPTKHIVAVGFAAAAGSAIAVFVTMFALGAYASHHAGFGTAETTRTYSDSSACNVLGIQVHGTIVASRADIPLMDTQPVQQYDGSTSLVAPNYTVANEIEDALRDASKDDSIKAILVDVDSPGGGVVSGQEIANAIRKSGKYSVSVIHEIGASAGYLSAAAANKVFAGRDSEVGSIGVTASFLNQYEKNQRDGVVYEQLSSGVYKDTYSPDKPLTADEKKLIMRDINMARDHFVTLVAEYRTIPIGDVDKLADGSTMLGDAALKNKLIDSVGTTWEALDTIEERIGEPVSLCWQ